MKKEELNELVSRMTQEAVSRIEPEVREKYHVKSHFSEGEESRYEYYQEAIRKIKGYEISGEPDTFIEASCMCEALIRFKCVSFDMVGLAKDADVRLYHEVGMINYRIALDVALAMIEKASVYEEQDGKWVEIPKHMDKKMTVPTGIIPNAPLRERIIRGLVCRDLGVKDFSTFEFSNTLHLIYLCNQ